MRQVVFIVSHLASGSNALVNLLNKNERVSIQTTHTMYLHPTHLDNLLTRRHKCRNSAAVYGDHLLYNINFQCKRLYDFCKFIYLIRGGKDTLQELDDIQKSYNYYCFRMRRIYEMTLKTPKAILLTWHDLESNNFQSLLEDYLSLKTPLEHFEEGQIIRRPSYEVPIDISEKAQDCYEYYLFKMKEVNYPSP